MSWWQTASDVFNVAKPFVNFGLGLYEQQQKKDFTKDYTSYLRDKEQRDYDRYLAELAASQAGAGVHAGYLEQALAEQRAAREMILQMYAPFIESAKRLLPEKEKLARQGLEGVAGLYGAINTPEMNANLNATPVSALQMGDRMLAGSGGLVR